MGKAKSKTYVPSLFVEITEEQKKALQELIPYGAKKLIFGKMIDSLIEDLRSEERETLLARFFEEGQPNGLRETLPNLFSETVKENLRRLGEEDSM